MIPFPLVLLMLAASIIAVTIYFTVRSDAEAKRRGYAYHDNSGWFILGALGVIGVIAILFVWIAAYSASRCACPQSP